MIVALFYTLFSFTKATDPPSTFVGVRRFDPVASSYDQVKGNIYKQSAHVNCVGFESDRYEQNPILKSANQMYF